METWLICVLAVLAVPVLLILSLLLTRLCCPLAFFKVKNPPGFILHAITGGKVPPYFCFWPFEDKYQKEVFRDGDVVCCVAAKSGTTWMLNIVHQIRSLGDPDNCLKHNTHTTPWPECMWYPGETPEDAFATLKTLDGLTNPQYPFRVYKSHYKPRTAGVPWKEAIKTDSVVPVRERPDVKYIVCMREGKDVIASFLPFFGSVEQGFKDMWGGFPPTFADYNECFDFFTKGQRGFYHGYAAQWWPYRHDPNVLVFHYNDLKKDIKACLRRVAEFVNVDVPEDKWPLIEEKVSIQWMKENENLFKFLIKGPNYTGNILDSSEGSMIRKGVNGDGANRMTPEQEKIWEQLNEEFFGDQPGLKEWILTGGPLPPLSKAEEGPLPLEVPGLEQPLLGP